MPIRCGVPCRLDGTKRLIHSTSASAPWLFVYGRRLLSRDRIELAARDSAARAKGPRNLKAACGTYQAAVWDERPPSRGGTLSPSIHARCCLQRCIFPHALQTTENGSSANEPNWTIPVFRPVRTTAPEAGHRIRISRYDRSPIDTISSRPTSDLWAPQVRSDACNIRTNVMPEIDAKRTDLRRFSYFFLSIKRAERGESECRAMAHAHADSDCRAYRRFLDPA
jgi:hypothetical protein